MDRDKFMTEFLLNETSNMFGKLNKQLRTRLTTVINEPTEKNWENAYSIVLNGQCSLGGITLWQAVIAIDPTFPRTGPVTNSSGKKVSGWASIPTREMLLAAILHAITEKPKAQEARTN